MVYIYIGLRNLWRIPGPCLFGGHTCCVRRSSDGGPLQIGTTWKGLDLKMKNVWKKGSLFSSCFLVPLIGGRKHIINQLAVYTTYIPLIGWFQTWFPIFFGEDEPIWTHIFQRGWNHQLVMVTWGVETSCGISHLIVMNVWQEMFGNQNSSSSHKWEVFRSTNLSCPIFPVTELGWRNYPAQTGQLLTPRSFDKNPRPNIQKAETSQQLFTVRLIVCGVDRPSLNGCEIEPSPRF